MLASSYESAKHDLALAVYIVGFQLEAVAASIHSLRLRQDAWILETRNRRHSNRNASCRPAS
jgi:hypothetical protein